MHYIWGSITFLFPSQIDLSAGRVYAGGTVVCSHPLWVSFIYLFIYFAGGMPPCVVAVATVRMYSMPYADSTHHRFTDSPFPKINDAVLNDL